MPKRSNHSPSITRNTEDVSADTYLRFLQDSHDAPVRVYQQQLRRLFEGYRVGEHLPVGEEIKVNIQLRGSNQAIEMAFNPAERLLTVLVPQLEKNQCLRSGAVDSLETCFREQVLGPLVFYALPFRERHSVVHSMANNVPLHLADDKDMYALNDSFLFRQMSTPTICQAVLAKEVPSPFPGSMVDRSDRLSRVPKLAPSEKHLTASASAWLSNFDKKADFPAAAAPVLDQDVLKSARNHIFRGIYAAQTVTPTTNANRFALSRFHFPGLEERLENDEKELLQRGMQNATAGYAQAKESYIGCLLGPVDLAGKEFLAQMTQPKTPSKDSGPGSGDPMRIVFHDLQDLPEDFQNPEILRQLKFLGGVISYDPDRLTALQVLNVPAFKLERECAYTRDCLLNLAFKTKQVQQPPGQFTRLPFNERSFDPTVGDFFVNDYMWVHILPDAKHCISLPWVDTPAPVREAVLHQVLQDIDPVAQRARRGVVDAASAAVHSARSEQLDAWHRRLEQREMQRREQRDLALKNALANTVRSEERERNLIAESDVQARNLLVRQRADAVRPVRERDAGSQLRSAILALEGEEAMLRQDIKQEFNFFLQTNDKLRDEERAARQQLEWKLQAQKRQESARDAAQSSANQKEKAAGQQPAQGQEELRQQRMLRGENPLPDAAAYVEPPRVPTTATLGQYLRAAGVTQQSPWNRHLQSIPLQKSATDDLSSVMTDQNPPITQSAVEKQSTDSSVDQTHKPQTERKEHIPSLATLWGYMPDRLMQSAEEGKANPADLVRDHEKGAVSGADPGAEGLTASILAEQVDILEDIRSERSYCGDRSGGTLPQGGTELVVSAEDVGSDQSLNPQKSGIRWDKRRVEQVHDEPSSSSSLQRQQQYPGGSSSVQSGVSLTGCGSNLPAIGANAAPTPLLGVLEQFSSR